MPWHNDIPTVPTELARLVADCGQSEERRHLALESLVRTIEDIARRTATRFPEWLRDDLSEESRTIVWLRICQFNPALGRFEDWCRVVLHNHGIDLWRKSHNSLVRPAVGGDESNTAISLAASTTPEETTDEVMERSGELRVALDRIAWLPSHGVNYFAVLLMQLRLSMVRRLTPEHRTEEGIWGNEVPDLTEWLLPWHPHEEEASFKPEWPPLSQLWSVFREMVGNRNSAIEGPVLCKILDRLLPPWVELTPDLWHHWVHRAKDGARCRLQDEEVWTRCFGRLLPDRKMGGP